MPTKLKSFELQGYKTFASYTEFEFADRVTAIIGPNGSGKSNIADALRWVLGEQSFSLLRGKKTEDMIFSGSETRSRAGMASATILFDNSDGWLPIDFSEVAITRRAYRDGQNEYLLNGQRVRLRDVSELLAQSGLAERTYTVIGQGLVDAALSLKADERRRLFEEAAGIGLYRSRKDEALRRLETTHRNIERVQDILAELQPRLRSLERQAKRAIEYERIKADLHVFLLDWYGYHWHQAQNELARVKNEVRSQEILLNKARNSQQELDNQITGFRDRIQGLRDQLAVKQNELSIYHSRKEVVTREIAVSNERIRSLNLGQNTAKAELVRHQDESILLDQRVNDAENELIHLNSELMNAKDQYEESRQSLEKYQARQAIVNQQIDQSKTELTNILTRRANLEAHTSRMLDQENQKKETFEGINASIVHHQSELKKFESLREKVRKTLQATALERSSNQEALTELKQRIIEITGERYQVEKNLSSFQADFTRARAESDVLEQAENTFQGYAEGTKYLLSAMQEDRLSGGQGALTRFLSVPANLETAIAAALGEYVDAFLLNDIGGVEQALIVLEQKNVRGILVPTASVNPYSPLVDLQNNDSLDSGELIGIASDLVEVTENLQSVIDLLLGQVIIVKDRTVAKKLLKSKYHPDLNDLRVVTLKGEVFHLRGPVVTGTSGKTILGRPRRQIELDQEMRIITDRLEELRKIKVKLDENILFLNEKLAQAEKRITDSLVLESRLENELRQIDVDFEKAERSIAWQIEQREKIEKDSLQRSNDLKYIQKQLSDIDQSISDIKIKIQEEESLLHAIPLNEQQAQFTYWNSRVAVLERALSDQQTRYNDLKSTKERSLDIASSISARIEQNEVELEKQGGLYADLTHEETTINAKIVELQEYIMPIEANLRSVEQDLFFVQKNDIETRQLLSAAEHNYAQSRITFSQVQDKLERLRHRIEDDFGLVEYQYAEEISGPTPLPLDGLVEKLPILSELPIEIDENIQRLRSQMRRIGPINPEAQVEYSQVSERINFLTDQLKDLQKAELDIREVIAELDLLMEREFRRTFDKVAQEFRQIFTLLFGGGVAKLELTEPDDMNETGIEIMARLPGRREQGLSLLSGGERSLTASALIFALLRVSPPPFCVLDEVDAMLDEANVGRFSDMLREMSQQTQFIVVTHNRGTIQIADVLYGVTMGRDSSSQVISLKMEDVTEEFGV